MRNLLFYAVLLCTNAATGQFAPATGKPGSTALKYDSSCFVHWASVCRVERGLRDIANPDSGYATAGNEISATGPAMQNGVVSLGDGGKAVLEFPSPIVDGPGWDFAVFENTFLDTFLELAFVEVSTDGKRFVRFAASSLSDTAMQTGAFGYTRPERVNNLAGKYIVGYGTPFDLNELKDSAGIDTDNIRFVRVVDAVGSLNTQYATRDASGRKINDPWPTRFASGGFDLDAVGVIHAKWPVGVEKAENKNGILMYPNPVQNGQLNVHIPEQSLLFLYDLSGREIAQFNIQKGKNRLDISVPTGMYFAVIECNAVFYKKMVVFK